MCHVGEVVLHTKLHTIHSLMPKNPKEIHNRRENAFKTTEARNFQTNAKSLAYYLTWDHYYAISHHFIDKLQIYG